MEQPAFASMEQPAFANTCSDPAQQPFLQPQNPIFYAPPLRIVAPPGVPPYLPQQFDPFNFFKGLRPQPFGRSGEGSSSAPPPVSSQAGCSESAHVADGCVSAKIAARIAKFGTGSAQVEPNREEGGLRHAEHGARSLGKGPISAEKGPWSSTSGLEGATNCTPSAEFGPGVGALNGTGNTRNETSETVHGEAKASTLQDTAGCAKMSDHKPAIKKKSTKNQHLPEAPPSHTQKKRGRESKPRRLPTTRPTTAGVLTSVSSHKAVINTVRLYDALRRNLLLEEESKDKDASKGSRPDLQAGSIINSKGLMVNRSRKYIGSVPGVEVGDLFYFRMELCSIGMHGPIQGGIEYLTVKESEYNMPVATSIISSGGYDATDTGNELVYTGQGGKSALDGKSNEDQKLERGNLAMESSMKHQVPVRVTRGLKDTASPSGKTYIYDGLYKVEQCWSEKGKFGFEEFKFKLCRLPGQPELGSITLRLSNSLRYRPNEREGLRLGDIAGGKEGMPVCVVNTVDNLKSPPPFEYSTILQYPQGATYQQFGPTLGCDCVGVCSASLACSCLLKNGSAFAYLNGGILVKERGVIYECGSNCQCSFSCRNRLTQKALKFRLEVFKTEDRGWGLRSWDTIPAGSFICEFTGRLVQNAQLLHTRDYVLDVARLPRNNPLWGDVSSILDIQSSQATVCASMPEFTIDASQIGNASRFINHSCSPNVLVQCVLRDHQDTKRPHLMLFAMDNIPPFKELTLDYGSNLPSSNFDALGKQCLCKSEDCKGKFYQ